MLELVEVYQVLPLKRRGGDLLPAQYPIPNQKNRPNVADAPGVLRGEKSPPVDAKGVFQKFKLRGGLHNHRSFLPAFAIFKRWLRIPNYAASYTVFDRALLLIDERGANSYVK